MELMTLVYCLPLSVILLLMGIVLIIWKETDLVLSPYPNAIGWWKTTNIVLALGSVGLILYSTILTREVGEREVMLIPFHFLTRVPTDNEAIRTVLMNLFLFFPLGLTAGRGLCDKLSPVKRVAFVTAIGLLLSVTVESIQYVFELGNVEADDLIANTAGAWLGAYGQGLHRKSE